MFLYSVPIVLALIATLINCNRTCDYSAEGADEPLLDLAYAAQDSLIYNLSRKIQDDTFFFDYRIYKDTQTPPVSFVGKAVLKGGDAECDEDENGVAYLVEEYVYNSGEYIAFRIEANTHRRARVVIDDNTARRYGIPTSTLLFPVKLEATTERTEPGQSSL